MFGLVVGICLVLLKTGVADPTSTNFPRCIADCAVTGLQKLYYVPGFTYSYNYKGESHVKVQGIQGAATNLQWEVDVDLHWTSPCDVVLDLRNPVLNGIKDQEFFELTNFPVMFSMSEGTVQGICFHPQEEPHNVNFKKGIIASLQNTLPSLSVIHSDKTYKEVDTLGNCPTQYKIKSENEKFIISKFKNHFDCSGYDIKLPNALKVSNLFRNSIFSPSSSSSNCVQEIENGILDSVKCEDSKVYNPTLSTTKNLSFKQSSYLKFQKKSVIKFPLISNDTEFKLTNLPFEEMRFPHSLKYVPILSDMLEDLCGKITDNSEDSLPNLVNNLVKLLEKIPTKKFLKLYDKIKANKICPLSTHFKSIFMDLLAYVDHEAAIKIMVDEIVLEKLTGFRKELYITSLFSFKTISSKSIEYMLPLFRNPKASSYVLLIAGNMIHKYCSSNNDCFTNPSLHEIFTLLTKSLREFCSDSSFKNDEERYELLLFFKTIGNMGYSSHNLEVEIFKCVSSKALTPAMRVAAIQSLRLTSCSNKSTDKLLGITLNEEENTEVRVEAFLQNVRCLSPEDIESLTQKLMMDLNNDVQSFIVSFINNTLKSQFPLFTNLKEYYQDKILQIDENNMTPSRNIDKGYYVKSFGLGFDSKTNLIFDEIENLQKYENTFYLSYLNEVEKVFEISTRIQNNLPFNFFMKNEENKNLETIDLSKLELYGKTVLLNLIKSNNKKLFSNKKLNLNSEGKKNHEWDAFIRYFDTEVFFFSLHYGETDLLNANMKSINNEILKSLRKVINNMRWNDINSIRAFHNDIKIFMPTVQGIPAVIKWDLNMLFGLDIKKDLSQNSQVFEVIPKFNSQLRFFVGYDFGSKVGVRNKVNINLSPEMLLRIRRNEKNKITLQIKTKESKINILNVRSEIYLFRKLLNNYSDEKIYPKFQVDSKSAITNSCIPPKVADSRTGTRLCWNINSSNIHKNKKFLFGTLSTVNFHLELDHKQTKAIELSSILEYKVGHSFLRFELEGLAPEVQKLGKIDFNATLSPSYKSLEIFTQGKESSFPYGVKFTYKENEQEGKRWFYLHSTSKAGIYSARDKLFLMNYEVPRSDATTRPNIDFRLKTLNKLAEMVNINIKVLADVRCKTYEESSQMHERIKESVRQMIHEFDNDSSYLFMRTPLEKTFGSHLTKSLKQFSENDVIFSIPFDFVPHEIDIQIGSGDLQTKSSLKTVTYEKMVSQYKFSTKLEGGRSLGGAKVEGFVAFKGLLDGNLVVTSKFNGKFGNSNEYQTDAFVKHHTEGTTVDLKAQNLSKKKLLALLKYSRSELPISNVKEEAEIALDGYVPHYKIEGSIIENRVGFYQVLYLLKESGTPLLQIEGPISISLSDDESQEVLNLTISNFNKGKYHIWAGYTLSKDVSRTHFNFHSPDKDIVNIKLLLQHPNTDTEQIIYQMKILDIFKVDFESENTVQKFNTNFEFHILPNSIHERQLTGYSQLNYEMKQFQAKFTCENKAKRTRVESVLIDSTYEASTEERFYNVRGNLKWPSESFLYNLELNLGSPKEKSTFKRILVEIDKHHKNFLLELLYHDNVFKTNIGDVTTLLKVQSNSKDTFEFGSNFCYVLETNTQVAGQVNMTFPNVDPIVIKVDFMSMSPKFDPKLIEKDDYAQKGDQKNINFFNPVNKWNSKFEKKLIQGIDFKFRTEALLPMETVSNLTLSIEKNSTENKFLFKLYENKNNLIYIHSEILNNGELLLNLFTYSKNIKISSKLLTKESSRTLYPNKEWTTFNYTLGGRYSRGSDHIYEDESIRKSIEEYKTLNSVNGTVNYFAQVAIPQTTMTGVVDLYLNKEEYERVSMSIESIELYKGSYKTEVIFRSPFFESDPRILLETTLSPNIKSLTLSYQHEASVSPSFSLSATYNSILKAQNTFYFFVKIKETEIELTSVFDDDNSMYIPFYKGGFTFNGSLRTDNDIYEFTSAHCDPGYLELGYQKPTRVNYVTKFALQNDLILVGIDRSHQQTNYLSQVCLKRSEFDERVAMTSVGLMSEAFLRVQSFYNVTEISTFLTETDKGSKKLTTEFKFMLEKVWQEIFLKIINEESKHLTKEVQDIFGDTIHKLKNIFKSINTENYLPNITKWIENVKKSHNIILRHFDELLRHLKSQFIDSFEELLREISSNTKQIKNVLQNILRKIIHYTENGLDLIESRLRKWNVFQTISNFLRSSSIWKLLENRWDFFVEHFKVEFGVIQELISRVSSVITEELQQVWRTLVSSFPNIEGYLRGFINWAYAKEPLKVMLKKFFTISVDPEGGSFDLEMPLRSPANTLRSALVKIGIPNTLSKDYFRIPFVNFNIWHEIILHNKNK